MQIPQFIIRIFLVTQLCLALACSSTIADGKITPLAQAQKVDPPPGAILLTANTYAGDALAAILLKRIDGDKSILVSSFVALENFHSSSPFGRTSMQQVSSRLAQNGFQVIEARLGDSLRINPQDGELFLTRETSRLLQVEHKAHAILVGVYSPTSQHIFLSTRVIRLDDGAILAAYEYYIPHSGDAQILLKGEKVSKNPNQEIWNKFAPRKKIFSQKPEQGTIRPASKK